jgi:hypothetical protein
MRGAALLAALLVASCHKDPAPAKTKHYTYRAIGGISAGGMGSSIVGTDHPSEFDVIAPLGGAVDSAYMHRYIESYMRGGFCSLAQLEAKVAAGKDLDKVADVGDCMVDKVPAQVKWEAPASYTHWKSSLNGGHINRDFFLNTFYDLVLAEGNPLYHNPDSALFPPGVTQADADKSDCDHPVVVPHFYNKEYNPEGKYAGVSFCDGQAPYLRCASTDTLIDWCDPRPPAQQCNGASDVTGVSDSDPRYDALAGALQPCYHYTRFNPLALAIDVNGNGKRDWGEPIAINGRERFQDVGKDGCPSKREDGKGGCLAAGAPDASGDPNHDDYDAETNATGTENDWMWEAGEPFEDNGLDGVPGTGDYGEGNGKYDISPNRQLWYQRDPRANVRDRWSAADRERIDMYTEGGLRDPINFGVMATQLAGTVKALSPGRPDAWYLDFPAWPGAVSPFDSSLVRESEVPRLTHFVYGNPNATPEQIANGDGEHVGTPADAINRFYLMLRFVGDTWPDVDKKKVTGQFTGGSQRIFNRHYHSDALGADRDFAIFLPPGYDEHKDQRYPVLYMMHGYGQSATDFGKTGAIFDTWMLDGTVGKFIIVFPSGRCCFRGPGGVRACTEHLTDDDTSPMYDDDPAYTRECHSHCFYMDTASSSVTGEPVPYEKSFFELVKYIDANWRTRPAADLVIQ